jgi:hypothetical protein
MGFNSGLKGLRQWTFRGNTGGKKTRETPTSWVEIMQVLKNRHLYHGSVEMGRDKFEPTLTYVRAHTSTTIHQALYPDYKHCETCLPRSGMGAEIFSTLKGDSVSHRYLNPGSTGL